jgi:rSAM/selenodomain-associated transferase 1
MPNAILLFVKYPEPGRVKTRLAATLGAEAAAAVYRELVAEVCARLPASDSIVVLFDPPEREAQIRQWMEESLPCTARFWPQGNGSLGERLSRAFDAAFAHGFQKVAVIGSDCVELEPAIFSQAWEALENVEGAIGPAEDGGYYLMALRQPCAALFEEIPWSTEEVFEKTVQRAQTAGIGFHRLPKLRDVDTEEDWRLIKARIRKPAHPSLP